MEYDNLGERLKHLLSRKVKILSTTDGKRGEVISVSDTDIKIMSPKGFTLSIAISNANTKLKLTKISNDLFKIEEIGLVTLTGKPVKVAQKKHRKYNIDT